MRISVANVHAMRLIDWQIQSSPHVRGTLETLAQLVFERGIIPACARDTCRVAGSPACRGDHLRMCGEHGAVVVELDCSKIPRDQLSRLEHQSGVIFGFSISVGSDAVPICRAPIARGYAFRTVGDHPRMCGEHANVCVFMTYLQQNLLAYPEHLSMLQNPIQHWFSCFSLRQFCFCLAGCHDALRPRRHTDVQLFSPQPRTRRRYPSRIISPAMGCVVI